MQSTALPDRRPDILLLIFSILSILGLTGRGVYLIVVGITSFDPASVSALASSLLGALSMAFCAVLLLPMMVYSIRHLKGQEIRPAKLPPVKFWQAAVLVSIWIFIVIFGSILNSLFDYGWVIAAPFFLLGVALPIAGLVWIATGSLPVSSWRRLWSAFGIGMTGSTLGAILLEYLIVGIGVLAAGILAAANPEWRAMISQLRDQITNARDMQALLTALAPYLTNPLVFLLILAFGAVATPLIEEALKPAALWLFGKRLHSPAEGFALGALCGAGFAMLEGMMAASGATEMMGFGLAGRAAGSLMHITASGLMGWGIASARAGKMPAPTKRYGRLAWTYLLSVTIHGLWNGGALLAVFGALRFTTQPASPDLLGLFFVLAGIGILGLVLVSILVILPIINHRLRPIPPAQNDLGVFRPS